MERHELKNMVKEVLTLFNFNKMIDKAINSSALDIDNLEHGDYRTAKNIVIAILENAADDLRPLSDRKKNESEIKNLKYFI